MLYKLPGFYNAYGTGGSTMNFFFILEPSVFIPRGGHSRTFQLEGMYLVGISYEGAKLPPWLKKLNWKTFFK